MTTHGLLRFVVLASVVLAGLGIGCDTGDSSSSGPCPHGQCGYFDYHYYSEFYCPPGPFMPGGWQGYAWHDLGHCQQECSSAANWGCDASGCAGGCETVHGTGAWVPCNGDSGTQTDSGCYIDGSGVNGETVACVCQ